MYTTRYPSLFGIIWLAADDEGLTGLWFEGQKYFASSLKSIPIEQETPILKEGKRWLDQYFQGRQPDFLPPLHPSGSAFQQAVWKMLTKIPYGHTITYGELAKRFIEENQAEGMSAQAIGGAVGHNPISIMIPCHRVIGAKGNLTGYAGGLNRKIGLLQLEKVPLQDLFIPSKGTAL